MTSGNGEAFVTYTPTVGYTGYDRLEYTGTASDGVARPEFVSVNVTDPGYKHAADKVALLLGKLTPSAGGQLSLKVHNANTFALRAVSLQVSSLARRTRSHPCPCEIRAVLEEQQAGRDRSRQDGDPQRPSRPSRLALLKQLGHVRVQVQVVLKAPGGTLSTVTGKGTLRAPK